MINADILMKLKKDKNFLGRFLKGDLKSVKSLEKNGVNDRIELKKTM